MKRIISFVLAALVLLGACAVSGIHAHANEDALENLFLDATVTTPNWYPETNPPSNLNDGETSPDPAVAGTVLCVYDGNLLCPFDIKLPEAKEINQVKVCFNWEDVAYRAKDIAVDAQLENGTWVRVAEMHDVSIYPDVEDFDLLFTFETVKAKAIRVTGNGARGNAPGWRVVEIEGYWNPAVTEADYTGTQKDANDAYNIPELSPEGSEDSTPIAMNISTPQWTPDDLNCLLDENYDPNNAPSALIAYGEAGLVQINVTFSRLKTVNQINLFHNFADPDYRPTDIAVDVQYEDGTWERVAEKHDITEIWPTGNGLALTLVFKTVEVQAVRITSNNARNGEAGYRLNEIEFCNYSANASEDTWTGTVKDANDAYNIPEVSENGGDQGNTGAELENLFADATVTTPNWYPESNPPSMLNDGKTSPNPAESGTVLCEFDGDKLCYFEFNLPEVMDINQVNICFNWEDVGYRAKDIAIDVQQEDGTWVRVAEMHNISLYPDVEDFDLLFTFETIRAKAVRITGNGVRNNAQGWRVVEIEGYLNPLVTETDYTGVTKDANDAYNIPEITNGNTEPTDPGVDPTEPSNEPTVPESEPTEPDEEPTNPGTQNNDNKQDNQNGESSTAVLITMAVSLGVIVIAAVVLAIVVRKKIK